MSKGLYPLTCRNRLKHCTHPLGNAKIDPNTLDFAFDEDGYPVIEDLAPGVKHEQNRFICPKCGARNFWKKIEDSNGKKYSMIFVSSAM